MGGNQHLSAPRNYAGEREGVQVKPAGDVVKLVSAAPVAIKSSPRIGIVLDADLDVAARWQSLRDRLAPISVILPASPAQKGTVVKGVLPDSRVGVWVMPNNVTTGILENFLGALVPVEDPIWAHARKSTAAAHGLGAAFSKVAIAKAEIHAWLSWQETPGLPFGTAITAKYFDTDTELCTDFVAWFRDVFAT